MSTTCITIDSNIAKIPAIVAKYVSPQAAIWCEAVNKCQKPSKRRALDSSIYYNTPISMADNVLDHKFDVGTLHFIYVDYSALNPALSRISNNLPRLTTPTIVISNADVFRMGLYNLKVGNCSKETVAELIASIVILHQLKSKPAHPIEIKYLLQMSREAAAKNQKLDAVKISNLIENSKYNVSQPMTIDLYDLLVMNPIDECDDCQVCNI